MNFWKHQEKPHIWHVFDRGVRQSPIFFTDEQRLLFLRLLKWAVRETGLQVLAYCLMTNHYHLLLKGAGESLSKCMQLLKSRFARELNRLLGTSGRVFQSNFKAYRAKNAAWVLDRINYIHVNPVVAGMVKTPTEYRWSSATTYLADRSELDFLNTDPVLSIAGGRESYRQSLQSSCAFHLDHAVQVDKVFAMQKGPEGRDHEEIAILMEECRLLVGSIRDTLIDYGAHGEFRESSIRRLASLLSQMWGVGTTLTLAATLVCSRRTINSYRSQGGGWIEQDPRRRRLVEDIHRRYFSLDAHGSIAI